MARARDRCGLAARLISCCCSRAYRGADELRDPHSRRACAQTTGRRLVRATPVAQESSDFWPGVKAAGRPPPVRPALEPQAESSDESTPAVSSFAEVFMEGPCAASAAQGPRGPAPPTFVRQILSEGAPSGAAPRFPLCTLCLSASELKRVLPCVAGAQWWGQPLEWGRRPFFTPATPVCRAFLESSGRSERVLGPIFRRLIRIRGNALGAVESPPEASGDIDASVAAVSSAMPGGLKASELKSVWPGYVSGHPKSAARSLCSKCSWVADAGPHVLEPLGVLSGMAA